MTTRSATAPAREVWIIDPLQLADLVRKAVRDALEERPEQRTWLDRDQVASLLAYKPSYIAELVRRRGLPCHRVGRKMRFRRDEVESWAVTDGAKR